MADPYEARDDGLRLYVKLAPKASRAGLGGVEQDADGRAWLKVRITAAPEKGKANKALLKLLAKHLGIAPSRLELIAGATDRRKVVRVPGLSADAIPPAFRAGGDAARSI